MEVCLRCGRGFCWEGQLESASCYLEQSEKEVFSLRVSTSGPGRPWKPDDEVEDPRSTMRKRAQTILKVERGIHINDPCEWSGLANVGGGRHPIVGCRKGRVRHIHHGPHKDWYHNTPDNLSEICNFCHNRWHSRNDDCYDPSIKSDPRMDTEEELALWNDGKRQPPVDHSECESIMVPK